MQSFSMSFNQKHFIRTIIRKWNFIPSRYLFLKNKTIFSIFWSNVSSKQFFLDGGPYHIETNLLICKVNQTAFYMVWTSVMKALSWSVRWNTLLALKCKNFLITNINSAIVGCHLLPFAVTPTTLCNTHCQSLSLALILCHSLYDSPVLLYQLFVTIVIVFKKDRQVVYWMTKTENE